MYRLQILPAGSFLVNPVNTALTIELHSVLFNNQDDLLGSISYPGTMAWEPNAALLKNARYINTASKLRTMDCLLWIGSLPFKQGKFQFTVENNTVNYNLLLDSAVIANQLKTLSLNKLADPVNNGQINFTDSAHLAAYMLATTTGAPAAYPMVFFPVKNDGAYVDAAYVTTTPYSPGTNYAVGIVFLWTNNHIYRVAIATTAGMTPLSNPDHFEDKTVYPDIALPVNTYFNAWNIDMGGTGSFLVDNGTTAYNNTQVPYFRLVYVLKRIAQYFGYQVAGKWLTDPDAVRIVLDTNVPVGAELIIADYNLFMPNMLVSDFIKEVRTRFGLLIDFDHFRKVCTIESLKYIAAQGDIMDLQQQQLSDYREIGNAPQAYTITEPADDKDTAFNDNEKASLPVLTVGLQDGSLSTTAVQLNAVATKMIIETAPLTADAASWRVPYIKRPVYGITPFDQVSTVTEADRTNFKLRFLYYHGMQANGIGHQYPYASADNLGPDGATALTSFTLALNPAGSAYLAIQAYYQYIYNSKPFEMGFLLSLHDLLAIRAASRIIIKDFNQTAVVCLFDQLAADLEDKEKIRAKLTLYPQVIPDNTAEVLPPPSPSPPPFDNGLVYARLRVSNPQTREHTYPPPAYEYHDADIYVDFFADSAGTTPKSVTSLHIRVRQLVWYEVDGHTVNNDYDFSPSGTSTEALHAVYTFYPGVEYGPGNSSTYTYSLLPSPHYTIIS